MTESKFTPEEQAQIQHEFDVLMDDYAHTLHAQKVDIITPIFSKSKLVIFFFGTALPVAKIFIPNSLSIFIPSN